MRQAWLTTPSDPRTVVSVREGSCHWLLCARQLLPFLPHCSACHLGPGWLPAFPSCLYTSVGRLSPPDSVMSLCGTNHLMLSPSRAPLSLGHHSHGATLSCDLDVLLGVLSPCLKPCVHTVPEALGSGAASPVMSEPQPRLGVFGRWTESVCPAPLPCLPSSTSAAAGPQGRTAAVTGSS